MWRRNWQLKLISLFLSSLLWLVLHYGRRPPKKASSRSRAAAARPASPANGLADFSPGDRP